MILVVYACSIGLPISEFDGVPSINGCLGGGITLATLVWCFGSISGSHLNPAVSIAFLFTGKINPLTASFYIASQLFGALSGSFILDAIVPEFAKGTLSVTQLNNELTLAQGFGVEFIITFILVLTVYACVDKHRNDLNGSFPLQIGKFFDVFFFFF
jgi:glycerol uptake facilitator-like aquaporin